MSALLSLAEAEAEATGIQIHPARDLDAGGCGAMLSAFVDDTRWMPRLHSRAQDIGFCAQMIAQGWVTVATGDRPLGFLARNGHELQALYVAPGAQGQGIGTALLADAQSRTDRLRLWTFQANARARRFYARAGFSEMRETDGQGNDEGLPDVELIWERTSA